MKIRSLTFFPCLFLLSLCSTDKEYYALGESCTIEYSLDNVSYDILFENKNENIVNLQIKRQREEDSDTGFGINTSSLIKAVSVNEIIQDSIEGSTGISNRYFYPVDFEDDLANIEIKFSSSDFDSLQYTYTLLTLENYDLNIQYFTISVKTN